MVRSADWLTEGWALVRPYLGTYALIALVAGLLSTLTGGLLGGPLACGWFMILLRQKRDPSYVPQFGDLWKGFEVFGPSFIAGLLFLVASWVVGLAVTVAQAIVSVFPILGQLIAPLLGLAGSACLIIVFMYTFQLIADRRMDAIEAIKLSYETTTAQFLPFAGFALLICGLEILGALFCGLGLLIAVPAIMAATAVSYSDVLGGGEPGTGAGQFGAQAPAAPPQAPGPGGPLPNADTPGRVGDPDDSVDAQR